MFEGKFEQGALFLGSSQVLVSYPNEIARWFRNLVDHSISADAKAGWVRIECENSTGRFQVSSSVGQREKNLELASTLAAFWEQATLLLIDQLRDGLALHAAALHNDTNLVLIPGASGNGKTQLGQWYRAHGFTLDTDELASISKITAQTCEVAALARPLFIKSKGPTFANADSDLRLKLGFDGAEILLTDDLAIRPPWTAKVGCIVFPSFQAGSPLSLEPLTTIQTGRRLLEHCVNVRNLPDGGLQQAAALARRFPALSLRYGHSEQLSGTLDVLTRQVLASTPSSDDFAALCHGLSVNARNKVAVAQSPVLSPQVEAPLLAKPSRRLTIGMASFDEYDGVYFTVQSIRLHHPEIASAIEFIVIDNNPGGPCSDALKQLGNWIDGFRYVARGDWHGTAIRDAIFEEATCEIVLCVDSHVLIEPGALSRLMDYCNATPGSRDLLQGPLVYDDLRSISTHFEPVWRGGMYGIWASDPRGADPNSAPFEIPMQGLGLFACRRDAWPGFNRLFRGFGGEEGYIHEKFRQRGGRTLCLPFLRWVHRFSRPLGTPYSNRWEDRIRNYYIGLSELGVDTSEMESHFADLIGTNNVDRIMAELRVQHPGAVRLAKMNGPTSLPSSTHVYSPHHYSFGDQWATINFYLNMSTATQQRIRLASLINGVDLYDLHRDILSELESTGEIELVRSEPSIRLNTYNVWQSPYFPTKTRWAAHRRHRYVSVQFDGESAKELKNASAEQELKILDFIKEKCPGFSLARLGKPLTVRECVEIAADSAFFVGVDSGMSHLCHSVGVPIFLLEYDLPTHTTHGGKAHTLCKGFEDFLGKFERFAKYLDAVDAPDVAGLANSEQECQYARARSANLLNAEVQSIEVAPIPPHTCDLSSRSVCEQVDLHSSQRQIQMRQVLSLLTPHDLIEQTKVRIGRHNDGGYVLVDDQCRTRICYSFGIGHDASWDYEMAERGATVYQYDHTVNAPPQQHTSFKFHSIGIGSLAQENFRSLQDLIQTNGHASERDMIFKMDIEGAEWDALDDVPPEVLLQFAQIIIEFHGFSELASDPWRERAERVLAKLFRSHVSVHVHGNNFSSFQILQGLSFPQVIEVTFGRRSTYPTRPGTLQFPTSIDEPNNPQAPDLYLSRFEF